MLDFNRITSEPLEIHPQLPITLGGKIVGINAMVVQGPLDFNFLFRRDYVYAMKTIMSILFRVMHFPHDGNIVTLEKLSFVSLDHSLTANHENSLNVPYMQVVSPPPQVNYVESYPMCSNPNKKDPLAIFSPFLDLYMVVEMVNHSIGDLDPNIPLITSIDSHDMYSF